MPDNTQRISPPPQLRAVPDSAAAAHPPRTEAEQKVWEALRAHPGATTLEVAQAARVGRSTAGKILAAWAEDGSLTRITGIATGGRRAADRWTIPDSTDTTTGERDAVVATEPENSDTAHAADHADSGTVTQETVPTETSEDEAGSEVGVGETEQRGPATRKARLGKGELRGLIEDFLIDHPGEEFGPTAIAKALTASTGKPRSSGAVNNGLEKLVAEGYAIKTQNSPKRFRIAKTDEPAN
ncbi:MarR family transcriptional regulator [Saccharopolyspora sp. NPDC003752]